MGKGRWTATNQAGAMAVTRREFIGAMGAAVGVPLLSRRAGGLDVLSAEALSPARGAMSTFGVQLYSIRRQMQANIEQSLAQVAGFGYKEVEFAGYFGKTPAEVRAMLDANGLKSPSAHSADVNTIRNNWAKTLDDAGVIGQTQLVCASLPGSERTADGLKRVSELFNTAGAESAKHGIRLAYHNHDQEFQPLGDTIGYDILLKETDPKVVSFQMDLFWIVKGGKDPLVYFAKHPGRFTSVHVKDMDAAGNMTEVGSGTLPFAKYFAQAKQAGIRHYFVEHDNPADPMASIKASADYLKALRS